MIFDKDLKEVMESRNGNNFFKNFYYSVAKISKYPEITKYFNYFLKFISIVSLITTLIFVTILFFSIKKTTNVLKQYMPSFQYSNNEFVLQSEEDIYLENKEIQEIVDGKVIFLKEDINENEIQEQIKSSNENKLIFTKSAVYINSEKLSYKDFTTKYFGVNILELNKEKLVNYFESKMQIKELSITSILYFISYFITYFIILLIQAVIISVLVFLFVKLRKKKNKFKEIFRFSILSTTISGLIYLIYFIISMFFSNLGVIGTIIEAAFIIIPCIYVIKVIYFLDEQECKNEKDNN